MIDLILSFDKLITLFLKNLLPHNHFFNLFFSFFSLKGFTVFLWIVIVIVVLILEERKHPGVSKKDKQFVIAFISTFLLTALTVFLLQNFFHRLRPITTSFNPSTSLRVNRFQLNVQQASLSLPVMPQPPLPPPPF